MAKKPTPSKLAPTAIRKPKANGTPTPLAALTHKDTRPNIPTEELRDFVKEEDDGKKTTLYPRNPDLDPQLVWKGKDEQDAKGLEVPAVPVFIQEKIHPQALLEDFRKTAAKAPGAGGGEDQGAGLFDHYAAFNGLPKDFAERVDFYHHQGHWQNRLILGDSLLVMNSLAEKEGLKGRVQCIYFDPPYGIKFGSNWQVSTRKRDVKDGKSEDMVRQPEQMRAFRDTWSLGIHSYLSYIRDRLALARDLLTESGSIFLQIGDENVHLVRNLMDEVFGSENFVAQIAFAKTSGLESEHIYGVFDFILFYARNKSSLKYRQLYTAKVAGEAGATKFGRVELPDGERRTLTDEEWENLGNLPANWRLWDDRGLTSQGNPVLPFEYAGKTYHSEWKTTTEGLERLGQANRLYIAKGSLRYIRYLDDFPVFPHTTAWTDIGGIQSRSDPKVYVVQTATEAVKRCLLMTTDPGDLVLDPTCGSGTTAFVAEQWGRRWITTDTSRVALTLARTRLMSARFPSYYLADQYPQVAISTDDEAIRQHLRSATPSVTADKADLRRGFVYKRVPHVTLKSIANNPDIKEGMTREQIDRAIKKHAETEVLYDKPYEDAKGLRVCGPFTVESLSPHRTLSLEAKRERSTVGEPDEAETGKRRIVAVKGPDDFGRLVLDNMKRAGVQNTFKGEKMVFETLEPHPGEWIQGSGTYTEKGGKAQRVAVCIGPEHGTVGPELVKEAAKEAVRGVGFDTLLIAGFAFDPHVGEEAKRYGKLTVLAVRINADIAMGELLKKTGAGNLFMIFGEPDVEITRSKSGEVIVEVKGLDVYDPTTGEVRSSSVDDIACWFIDTDYNGESFFVRHAYFTGAGSEKGEGPYDRLKRALRAEVNEGAWSTLYSTRSRPFAAPKGKKIAVKMINHFGDEVMKVYGA
ncbi:site-specific DNA-methyltransferase [soil metagenome]